MENTKKTAFYALVLSSVLLVLFACSSRNKTFDPEFGRYISAFTSGNVYNGAPIEIQLISPPSAVEVGGEVDQNLFDFSPSIKGKAYWKNANTISYVPDEGELKPGTTYDAWFNLGKVSNVDAKFKEFYFSFQVPEQNYDLTLMPYTAIDSENLNWNELEAELRLANTANLEDIEKMFSITDQRNKAKISVTPLTLPGRYLVKIDSLYRDDNNAIEYTLHVDPSKIKAQKDKENIIITLPGMPVFQVLDYAVVTTPQECIRFTFSDPLSTKQNIKDFVTIQGYKNYTYELDKNILKIFLDTEAGKDIDVVVHKELKNLMDKPLGKTTTYTFSIERNEPQIKLVSKSSIIPKSGQSLIYFQAANLWAVEVEIVKVYESNILSYLQDNSFGETDNLQRFGRLEKKTLLRLDSDPALRLDKWNTFPLDLSSLFKQEEGAIYQLTFTMKKDYSLFPCDGVEQISMQQRDEIAKNVNTELTRKESNYWNGNSYYYNRIDWGEYNWEESNNPCFPSYYMDRTYSTMILSSDLGVTVKNGENNVFFTAVNDINTTQPVSGAKVTIYNYQLQPIGSGSTNDDGMLILNVSEDKGIPSFMIAEKNGDKNYLKLNKNLSLSLSNFDVSGTKVEKGLQGYIYGERGVWRPGDSIFLNLILSDRELRIPEKHPATMELFNPQGQLAGNYASQSVNGFYTFKFATAEDAPTGYWDAVIKLGGVTFTKNLRIETIKPNRLKVKLDLPDVIVPESNRTFKFDMQSQWLHGAPASDLKASIEMSLTQTISPFKNYRGYVFFNPISNFGTITESIFNGQLNGKGEATILAQMPKAENAPSLLKANFISRVFENGGDASINVQSSIYSPFSSYVGVKVPEPRDGYWLQVDQNYKLDVVTVNAEGNPVDVNNLNVKIYKVGWSWWWSGGYDDLASYVNSSTAEVVMNKNFKTSGGKAAVDFKVDYPNWGRFLVLVTNKDSGHVTGQTIYVDWPDYMGRSERPEGVAETMLTFNTDKKKYNVGETGTIILPKASNGRALITFEDGSRVIEKHWVTTSATQDTKFIFKVTKEMAPNIYIYAAMFQPVNQTDNSLPIRMYGIVNVDVEDQNTILKPVIKMADELKPDQNYTIEVSEQSGKGMTYTLAVVDEGLLDLTNFKTPNAWNDFFAKQALGVRTWDMYDFVLGRKAGKFGPILSIGGDEELVNKQQNMKRFKPVVTFLGPITLKPGGKNVHTLKMPAYFGSVRVMVVAANNQEGAYGNAEKAVPVRNKLMLLSTLTRVAGPNEEISLPINVFLYDKNAKNVSVKVKAKNGLFTLPGNSSQNVSFDKEGDQTIYFNLNVGSQLGFETIEITAEAGGEKVTETINIEVRNPNPPIVKDESALIEAGQTATLTVDFESVGKKDWLKLEVSRMPGINLNKSLKYLLDYPHGCSEQVTSRAFPALFVETFRKNTPAEQEMMQKNVKSAIEILGSRQFSNGGFAYWPGNTAPSEWVSTYATHFLIEAEKAGYQVPNRVKSKAIEFLRKAAIDYRGESLYRSYYSSTYDKLQQAYRLYVLALANVPELGAMNRLKENKTIDTQTRWRLAAAYALAGRKDVGREIIAATSTKADKYDYGNDTYGSYPRDLAMIIESQVLLDDIQGAMSLAKDLASQVNSSSYLTTQTSAYSLLALSQLAKKVGNDPLDISWSLNGTSKPKIDNDKVYQEIEIDPSNKNSVTITNNGKGVVYARLIGMTQPLIDNTPAASNGLQLSVKYLDAQGKTISIDKLKQGTEFFAQVTVTNTSGRFIPDVTLSQIFASGWEIFNTRLFGGSSLSSSGFNYQDIRDDRVYTYFNLGANSSNTYVVRLQAAYCGKFYLPAVACEAMYNPSQFARTTGTWVEVYK